MDPITAIKIAQVGIPIISSIFGKKKKRKTYGQMLDETTGWNIATYKKRLKPFYDEEVEGIEATEAKGDGARADRLPDWAAQMQEAALSGGLDIGQRYAGKFQKFQRDFGSLGEREDLSNRLMGQADQFSQESPLMTRLREMGMERLSRTRGEERDLAQQSLSTGRRIDPAMFGAMQRLSSADTDKRMSQAAGIHQLSQQSKGQRIAGLGQIGGMVGALRDDPMKYTSLAQGYGMMPAALQGGSQALGNLSGVGKTGAGLGYELSQQAAAAAEPSFLDRLQGGMSQGASIGKGFSDLFTPKPMYSSVIGGDYSGAYDQQAASLMGSSPDWMR